MLRRELSRARTTSGLIESRLRRSWPPRCGGRLPPAGRGSNTGAFLNRPRSWLLASHEYWELFSFCHAQATQNLQARHRRQCLSQTRYPRPALTPQCGRWPTRGRSRPLQICGFAILRIVVQEGVTSHLTSSLFNAIHFTLQTIKISVGQHGARSF